MIKEIIGWILLLLPIAWVFWEAYICLGSAGFIELLKTIIIATLIASCACLGMYLIHG